VTATEVWESLDDASSSSRAGSAGVGAAVVALGGL
jgi:hypothetical protein